MCSENTNISKADICFHPGTVELAPADLTNIVSALSERLPDIMETLGDINWSWYEPVPESLLDTEETAQTLHPILRKNFPDIKDGVQFSELMLFSDRAGLILVRDGEETYRYSLWHEIIAENPPADSVPVTIHEDKTILRDAKNLHNLFRITTATSDEDKLNLKQYRHRNKTVAWTIQSLPPEKAEATHGDS